MNKYIEYYIIILYRVITRIAEWRYGNTKYRAPTPVAELFYTGGKTLQEKRVTRWIVAATVVVESSTAIGAIIAATTPVRAVSYISPQRA